MMKRISQHAGSWYAGSESTLKAQLHDLFTNKRFGYGKDPLESPKDRSSNPNLIGIVSPHAGYVYSGSIASHGYAEAFNSIQDLDIVIILGPNHRGVGAPISFYPEGSWVNPLGSIRIDNEGIDFAKSYDFGSIKNKIGFEPSAHVSEHSIDIQLPFLQYLFPDFQIMPICLGDQSYDPVAKLLAKFLKDFIQNFTEKRILIVASSDFSHENNSSLVVDNDKQMLSYLERAALEEAEQFRRSIGMTMCGYGPVFALIHTAELLGNPVVKTLKYANSSDIKPGGGYTVGYASIVVQINTT
ncbi:MAG: AmmeMemoRadiSam system protein B [Candidatus Hodarchaeales archaeon]|jgi:AmmeMemoRadiSam system protein B